VTKKTVYIVGGNYGYYPPFAEAGYDLVYTSSCKPDLYVFTGGADINPALYGETPHRTVSFNDERDKVDIKYANEAFRNGIPCVGICRGAQFLNVMNGGKLLQHVEGHAIGGTHPITTIEGDKVLVTSTHHQMMWPKKGYALLAWFDPDPVRAWGNPEPEVVWYPETRSLCVQYHPEYMGKDTEGWKYFQKLLGEYIK